MLNKKLIYKNIIAIPINHRPKPSVANSHSDILTPKFPDHVNDPLLNLLE